MFNLVIHILLFVEKNFNNSLNNFTALITISHRPSLFKYHTHLLLLSGDEGSWKFETIGTKEERMSLDNEVAALEAKLKDVESNKARIEEINKELQLGIPEDKKQNIVD